MAAANVHMMTSQPAVMLLAADITTTESRNAAPGQHFASLPFPPFRNQHNHILQRLFTLSVISLFVYRNMMSYVDYLSTV